MDTFLQFLALDMASHPERMQSLNTDIVQRIHRLTETVEVDLDEPLLFEDE